MKVKRSIAAPGVLVAAGRRKAAVAWGFPDPTRRPAPGFFGWVTETRPEIKSWLLGTILLLGTGSGARADVDTVVLFPAYSDGREVEIEGRVIEERGAAEMNVADSWWRNLVRTLRTLVNDERAGANVSLRLGERAWQAVTDKEGFFRVRQTVDPALAPGWKRIEARLGERRVEGELLVVPGENVHGIISDLDDTILVSEVTDKSHLVRNTLLRNALQREAVPGAAAAYRKLAAANAQAAAAPVFYLSASPRQLHGSIAEFLAHNNFPHGVLITKRIADGSGGEPLFDQAAYKTAHIERIFACLPQVRFTLVGDDGERDPEIYQAVRERHPQRVAGVWIRRVHTDPARARYEKQGNLDDLTGAKGKGG
jgi:phosphatidate phosphatase APP1